MSTVAVAVDPMDGPTVVAGVLLQVVSLLLLGDSLGVVSTAEILAFWLERTAPGGGVTGSILRTDDGSSQQDMVPNHGPRVRKLSQHIR